MDSLISPKGNQTKEMQYEQTHKIFLCFFGEYLMHTLFKDFKDFFSHFLEISSLKNLFKEFHKLMHILNTLTLDLLLLFIKNRLL